MITLSLKAGASFQACVSFKTGDGARTDLSGCTFACVLRTSTGGFVANIACSQPKNVPWAVNLAFAGSTSAWPAGRYFAELAVTDAGGVIKLSETFGVIVNDSFLGLDAA